MCVGWHGERESQGAKGDCVVVGGGRGRRSWDLGPTREIEVPRFGVSQVWVQQSTRRVMCVRDGRMTAVQEQGQHQSAAAAGRSGSQSW